MICNPQFFDNIENPVSLNAEDDCINHLTISDNFMISGHAGSNIQLKLISDKFIEIEGKGNLVLSFYNKTDCPENLSYKMSNIDFNTNDGFQFRHNFIILESINEIEPHYSLQIAKSAMNLVGSSLDDYDLYPTVCLVTY